MQTLLAEPDLIHAHAERLRARAAAIAAAVTTVDLQIRAIPEGFSGSPFETVREQYEALRQAALSVPNQFLEFALSLEHAASVQDAYDSDVPQPSDDQPVLPDIIEFPPLIPPGPPPKGKTPRRKFILGCLISVVALLTLTAAIVAVVLTYNYWKKNTPEIATLPLTATFTPTSGFVTLTPAELRHTSSPGLTATPLASLPAAHATALGQVWVTSLQGEVLRAGGTSFVPLNLHESLVSPTGLASGPESGAYLEFIDLTNRASYAYLFYDSTFILAFDTTLRPELVDGRLYIQPGQHQAEIHFPSHHNVTAYIEASAEAVNPNRMIVETVGSDIWIWCLLGTCRLENEAGVSTQIPVMTRQLYHSATDTFELPVPITLEELWAWQVACAYTCLTGFVSPPGDIPTLTPTKTRSGTLPTPTRTPTPLVTNTRLPVTLQPSPTKTSVLVYTPTPTRTLPPYPVPTLSPVPTLPPPLPTPTPTLRPTPTATQPIPYPECSDGADNDGDGTIDYNGDPGCESWTDDDEHQACNDGNDNDGDYLIDMADPGCSDILDTSEVDDEGRPLSTDATGTTGKSKFFLSPTGQAAWQVFGLANQLDCQAAYPYINAPCWSVSDSGE